MRLWTVHEPGKAASAAERADKTMFVKDGFCWPALLIPLLWLLYRRLWLGTLLYVVVAAAVAAAGALLPLTDNAGTLLAFLVNLWIGFEGNDMRRRKLARKGHVQVGSIAAKKRLEAELAFFAGRVEEAPFRAAPAPAAPQRTGTPVRPHSGHEDRVLGLFPQPEGPR